MKLFSSFSKSILTLTAAMVLFTGCKDDEDPIVDPDPTEQEITITSIDPTEGPIGTEVTITGTNFGGEIGDHVVEFNGTEAEISSVTDNTIVVIVPENATTGVVSLMTQGETITGPEFTVTVPDPGITSIRPASGAPGMEIKINGYGFGSEMTDQVVTFNGVEAEIVNVTNTQVIAIVPEEVTTGPVSLTTGGETFEGPEFRVLEEEIAFTDGFSMDAGIVTLGQAFVYQGGGIDGNTAIRLVPGKSDRTGAAYYGARIPVENGFETTFDFRITRPGKPEDVEGDIGADGFAFIIQNQGLKAIGNRGPDLGYGGINNAVVVEFDIYKNPEDEDPNRNHLSIQASVGGGPVHGDKSYRLAQTTNETHPDLPNFIGNESEFHTARVVYEPGLLKVYVDDMETPLEANVDLGRYLNSENGTAYVGFTGSTSPTYGWAAMDILNWTLVPTPASESDSDETTSE